MLGERGKADCIYELQRFNGLGELRLGNHLFIEQIRSLIERKSGIMDIKNPDFRRGSVNAIYYSQGNYGVKPLPSGLWITPVRNT